MFAAATFLAFACRRLPITIALLAIAGLVSFTRIYTGVHYPSDVLGGAALGAGLAALVWMAKRPLESRFAALRAPQQSQLEASVAPWRE